MMDMIAKPGRRTRRRHSLAFKRQVVAACLEPGVPLSAVALANGLNANLLRQWVKAHQAATAQATAVRDGVPGPHPDVPATLVPVRVQRIAETGSDAIRVTIRRGQQVTEVSWPVSAADACRHWLSGLWR